VHRPGPDVAHRQVPVHPLHHRLAVPARPKCAVGGNDDLPGDVGDRDVLSGRLAAIIDNLPPEARSASLSSRRQCWAEVVRTGVS